MIHCGQSVGALPFVVKSLTGYCVHGVHLFFTVSALTMSIMADPQSPDWSAFYIRRFFRIAPMFYLAAAAYLLWHGLGPQYFAPHGIGWRQILLTFLFMHGLSFDSLNSVVPGGWSIASEAIFYLIFPALVFFVSSWRRAVAFSVATVLLAFFSDRLISDIFVGYEPHYLVYEYLNYSFLDNATAFAFGILAFHSIRALQRRGKLIEQLRSHSNALLAITWIGILECAVSVNTTLRSLLVAEILIFFLVMASFLHHSEANSHVSRLGHIGIISFSIYLIHFAVLDVAKGFIPTWLDPLAALLALFVVVLSVSIGCATITYHCIEAPMTRIGRGFRAASRQYERLPTP